MGQYVPTYVQHLASIYKLRFMSKFECDFVCFQGYLLMYLLAICCLVRFSKIIFHYQIKLNKI